MKWRLSLFSQKTFYDIKHISILIVVCGIFCFFILNVNSSTFMMPQYGYDRDSIFGMMSLKALQESSLSESSRLSSPFDFSYCEFPGDKLLTFIIFLLSKTFSLNIWGALNLYYLLTYFLSVIITFIVLRKFNISASWSILSAIAYTFMPYHFYHGVTHLALASYYLIPVSFLAFSWLFNAKNFKWSYFGATVFYCILLGLQAAYYYFFSAIILGALFLRTIRLKNNRFTVTILLILVISFLAFLSIFKLPVVFYQIDNGANYLFINRHFSEASKYALHPTSIVLPPLHSILPQNNEAGISYVGLLGIFGLLCLFIPGRQKNSLYEMMRFVFIVCFFFCTVDGLGLVFSYHIGGMIRGLNRVIVYLAFIAFLTAAKELNLYTKNKSKPIYLVIFTCTCVIVFFDFFDYKAFVDRVKFNNPYAIQYESDQKFFMGMESVLPAEAQVYQLPYMPFPEMPFIHNMSDYEHFKAFLHTETLRFSYGANKGRQADYWNRYINSLSTEEMVKELEACGFRALYLDTAGYPDQGIALVEKLKNIIGREPTYSPDGRRLFSF